MLRTLQVVRALHAEAALEASDAKKGEGTTDEKPEQSGIKNSIECHTLP